MLTRLDVLMRQIQLTVSQWKLGKIILRVRGGITSNLNLACGKFSIIYSSFPLIQSVQLQSHVILCSGIHFLLLISFFDLL